MAFQSAVWEALNLRPWSHSAENVCKTDYETAIRTTLRVCRAA